MESPFKHLNIYISLFPSTNHICCHFIEIVFVPQNILSNTIYTLQKILILHFEKSKQFLHDFFLQYFYE